MMVAVYRWRLKPGMREAFVAAWSERTQRLIPHGSGGSALFDGPDGQTWGLARWPDRETRANAFAADPDSALSARMAACIDETFEALELDAVTDLWTAFPPPRTSP